MPSILWTAATYLITASLGAAAGLILGGLLSSNRIDEAYEEGYLKGLRDNNIKKTVLVCEKCGHQQKPESQNAHWEFYSDKCSVCGGKLKKKEVLVVGEMWLDTEALDSTGG